MSLSHDQRQALAMSYVLGEVTADELKLADNMRASDPEFAALVIEIEDWLAPLNASTPDKTPPFGLFDEIMQGISEDNIASAPVAANDSGPGFWKPAAIAAACVAVLSLATHLPAFAPEIVAPQDSRLVAMLADDSNPALVVIVYDPTSQKVVARMSNVAWPENGDFELWLIRDGEAGPRSLGILNKDVLPDTNGAKGYEFDIPSALNPGVDTLAVSLEPRGGSGDKGPQGPVLYVGKVSTL